MKICVFSTEYSYRWLKAIHEVKIENVSFQVIFYNNLEHLKVLFKENYQKYNAVLCSGQIPYLHIKNNCREEFAATVCQFVDITERDFYLQISKIQFEHPNFSFDQTLIDFLYEENNYLGLKEWLPKESFPYILDTSMQAFGKTNAYDVVAKRHLSLLHEGKIKFCFTRLTNLYTYFTNTTVKPIVFSPSLQSIQTSVEALLKEVEVHSLINSQVVCGHLQFSIAQSDVVENEYRQVALYKAILDFKRKFGYSLLLYRSTMHTEIITNYSDYLRITNEGIQCELAQFLHDELPFKVKIGWGIGKSLVDAQTHAEEASTYCKTSKTESYCINKQMELSGPLNGTERINENANKKLEEIAKETNISLLHLQHLHQLTMTLEKDSFTAEEISKHLAISVRTANRLINKLQDYQYATFSETIMPANRKGRPKNAFQLKIN